MSTDRARAGPASAAPSPNGKQPKLLDRVRTAIRVRHYSLRTEEAYVAWIKRFIFFHGVRHPAEMGAAEINQFLSDLAVNGRVSASTQNQAFSALLFLYEKVLEMPFEQLQGGIRANRSRRLPVVLTRAEVKGVFAFLDGTPLLVCLLLYGAGLRLLEALRLRVQDIDFVRHEILVRDGKGHKDRITVLPGAAKERLAIHLDEVRAQHERDLRAGVARSRRCPHTRP